MERIFAMFCGGLFGGGIALSGILNPVVVQGFLDPFGNWNPTLLFFIIGASASSGIAWRIAARGKRATPAAAPKVNRRLVVGALVFGFGWGLAGICPGPVLISSSFAGWGAALFIAAMLAGIAASSPVLAFWGHRFPGRADRAA